MRANGEAGRVHGKNLYGYRRLRQYDAARRKQVLTAIIEGPDQALIVKEAVRRVIAGDSYYEIVKSFNERRIPVRRQAYKDLDVLIPGFYLTAYKELLAAKLAGASAPAPPPTTPSSTPPSTQASATEPATPTAVTGRSTLRQVAEVSGIDPARLHAEAGVAFVRRTRRGPQRHQERRVRFRNPGRSGRRRSAALNLAHCYTLGASIVRGAACRTISR